MELWNQKDLVPPVLTTVRYKSKQIKTEIRALTKNVLSALQYFEAQAGFDKAAAYASRFTTRWRNRFYNMHGFRLFRRLNQALLRFRSLDIVSILSNLASLLPDGSFIGQTVDLPTRAYLDYVLMRLQGIAKLFCRIVTLAEEACRYYVRFMSTGYFFNLSSMFLCLLSEVWYKSKDMCKHTVEFYNELITFRPLLDVPHAEWPPGGGIDLPVKLCVWLGDDWTDKIIAEDSHDNELNLCTDTSLFHLLTADEIDLSTARKIDERIDSKVPAIESTSATSVPQINLMARIKSDVGEFVLRKQEFSGVPGKRKQETPMKTVEAIKSKFDAKAFLDEEKKSRRENLKQALSRNVATPAFNSFASSMLRDMNKLSTGDFLRSFKLELSQLLGLKHSNKKRKQR